MSGGNPGKKKIFYVVSHVHKSLAFEWISIRLKEYYDVTFILMNSEFTNLEKFLISHQIKVVRLPYSKKKLPVVLIRLIWIFLKERPSVVHTHLFEATLLGLAAAWVARVKKRIYTRHNSTYHHLYHPEAVKYDRWTNFLATQIISISQATDEVLIKMEGVNPDKIKKIPHGFDFSEFITSDAERINLIRKKWGIPTAKPIVGVVARHIEWKGIQFIIPAFKEFLKVCPSATLVLANASGPFHEEILAQLKQIAPKNFILISFEEDAASLFQIFDLYVHTPIDQTCEAYGQTYVEALAAGVPSIFTLSGIAQEFVVHTQHAWVVDFKNPARIAEGMVSLWADSALKKHLAENGRQAVTSRFDIDLMITRLRQAYDQ